MNCRDKPRIFAANDCRGHNRKRAINVSLAENFARRWNFGAGTRLTSIALILIF
jgi:hypothetical protein